MDSFFYFGAEYLYLVILIIAAVFFIRLPREGKKRILLSGSLTLPFSYMVAQIAASLYFNPTPFDPLKNGFPSDHTLLVAAVAAVVWHYHKRIGILLWVMTLLVGVSRIYVGAHHLVDIVTSIAIAVLVSYAAEKAIFRSTLTK